jgi:predicted DNA repair protein MutK
MATGLIALLDDIAALAKVAAASLDDAAAQATKAGAKATGIVIDDAAVTPRFVTGFTADRELPIVGKIALGSLKNKMLFLLPGALILSLVAPWSITPLLMIGGAYLCLEGFHKVLEVFGPHAAAGPETAPENTANAKDLENEKVASAIRTDFILSAEIMAITLAAVTASPLVTRAVVLAIVGVGMTGLVYGFVALIVKADDFGTALAQKARMSLVRALGRGIVNGMPGFLTTLSHIGMVAMLWVGGGIITHGLHVLGVHGPEDLIKSAGKAVSGGLGPMAGFFNWLVGAGLNAVIGFVVGATVTPMEKFVFSPLYGKYFRKAPKPAHP